MTNKTAAILTGALEPSNQLYGTGSPVAGSTALDFWRWALGDLHQNSTRGIFAEWVVAKLLDSTKSCRDPWAECDIVLENGIRIEVKSAARRQAWHEDSEKTSAITFSGLHGKRWSAQTGYTEESTYNAEIYIFCLLENRERDTDPLDLQCWRFWIMSRDMLGRPTVNSPMRRSITLASLIREGVETTADDLRRQVDRLCTSLSSKEY